MINFEKNKRKIIKNALKSLKYNLGERNTAILLQVLIESCEYTMGKKGLREVRQIDITYNNLFKTKCNLKGGFNISHE